MGPLVPRRQHDVPGLLAAAVQNDLHVVRHAVAPAAWLVAVDQHPGADLLGKRPSVLRTVVPPPDQVENARTIVEFHGAGLAGENRLVEPIGIGLLGHAVRDEHAAGQTDGQRAALQERQIRLADLLGGRAVHVLQAQPEHQIEHLLVLLDRVFGQFGQFVVAQDEMDPAGELDDQLGHVLEHGVGHAAAVLRIDRPAVADLLEDQLPPGMSGEVGDPADQVEIPPVAVQIAGDHHLVGQLGRHDHDAVLAGPARGD